MAVLSMSRPTEGLIADDAANMAANDTVLFIGQPDDINWNMLPFGNGMLSEGETREDAMIHRLSRMTGVAALIIGVASVSAGIAALLF